MFDVRCSAHRRRLGLKTRILTPPAGTEEASVVANATFPICSGGLGVGSCAILAHRSDVPYDVHYHCQRCTACCRWPGQVKVSDAEIAAIAEFLGLGEDDFIQRVTRLRTH